MTHMNEVSFADFQMEERYKKLKRTLKLASLRRENEKKDQLRLMSISPSISSINAETLDSTSTIHSSQVSKIGSEVISSSNNLRNIQLKTKGINNDHRMIVTSTAKKFNKENNCLEDHIMMPPPNVNRHVCSLKRLNNTATHPAVKSSLQMKCYSSDIDTESPTKRENYRFTNEDKKCNGSFNPLLIRCDSLQNSNVRIFTKWKVILNEQNQLIIKGRIECGKMAWSKPIVRRLTSVKVESVFKHLYQLQGNLVDDEYELPEYVRGKFHSGFPDDWKNVYQLWRSFVQQGCSATFRWPTPVADSDDDFTSVITEYVTCTDSRNPKDKESNLKFHKESYAAVDSDCAYNNLQIRKNQSPSSYRYQTSDSFTQTNLSIGNISRTKTNIHSSGNQYNNDKENYEQQGDVNLNYSYTETVSNSLKDKLNAIVNNLDKNCPQEYISKIIEIFDCLKYVVSYRAIKEDGSNIEDSKLKTNKYMIKGQHNKINDTSKDYVESESISLLNSMGNRVDCSMSLQKKRTFTEMSRNDDINISDTESEIYAGVRKIPTGRIIQKETLLNPCKYKMRKKMYRKHDAIKKQNVSNVLSIMSNHNNESCIKLANSEGINDINFNDSNISDIEDERNHLEIKEYISSKNEDIILVDSENKDTQKIQKHRIQQNSTDAQSIQYLHDSYEIIKNNEYGIDVTEEYNNKMTVANCYIQSNTQEKSRYMNDQCQNHSPGQQHEELLSDSKTIITTTEKTKPVIIDSTLVNIKNMAIRELNEKSKNRSLTDKKSPKASTNSLRDSNQCSEDCVESQSSNIDSIIPKKLLRDNLNVFRDNEASDSCKPRLLSAWTPRVLYKSGLHLIFEGKLLNEVGHVMNRKFQTDVISRRVSQKVVETVYHEFYQLIGDLNDTKHVVPKKLVNYCRYGCPTNIEQFCKMWKSSENANLNDSINATENCNTTSVDSINVGVSSKGRKIIPPLSYWTGERVALKDNSPVYNPGTSKKDPLIIFSPETVAKSKNVKTRKQRNERIKKNTSETPKNDIKTVKRNTSKRYIMKNKRQEELESSDSSDENISIYKHKFRTNLVTTEPTVKKSKVRKDIESNTSLSSPFKQL
ncbi:hypothetical protein K0M31_006008 [Melipona bicolor]|nr:hypothetical protein K0M31_006008 [Melipona bicolor]